MAGREGDGARCNIGRGGLRHEECGCRVHQRIGIVAGGLYRIGNEVHRHADVVLQLRESRLRGRGALHCLHQREQASRKEKSDEDGNHQFDESESFLMLHSLGLDVDGVGGNRQIRHVVLCGADRHTRLRPLNGDGAINR